MSPDKVLWTKPESKIANYFTVKDALWLPTWGRMSLEKDGLGPIQKANLCVLFYKMDSVRNLFGKPIVVHVSFRSKSYNKEIGGAQNSSHIQGMAVDFHVQGMDCDMARLAIVPKLEEWGMRCENLKGSSWVHLDIRDPGPGGRYFIP